MPGFSIGSELEHVRVSVQGRELPSATDYWDGNWVVARVDVRLPPWSGSYDARFRAEDFQRFREAPEAMHLDLLGGASFFSIEPWLQLDLKIDAHGRVSVEGEAKPEGEGRPFGQVGLKFELLGFLDQSYLPGLIAELRQIESMFPVKGDPSD